MNLVQPIRDRRKIDAMRALLRGGGEWRGLRDALLFTLGVNSALRVSDLLALRVRDVAESPLGPARPAVVLQERKTGKTKSFALGAGVRGAIGEYLRAVHLRMDSPLFPSGKGRGEGASDDCERPISRQHAWDRLNRAARQLGLENVGTHTLRKTFGYHAYLQTGKDLGLVCKLLNHASPRETLRYIGIEQDALDEIYTGLNL